VHPRAGSARCAYAGRDQSIRLAIGFAKLTFPMGKHWGQVEKMPITGPARSADAIHRKLRAIVAVLSDRSATEHERANAKALKTRLEKQLKQAPTPEGKWTGMMFRLGRAVQQIKQSKSPSSRKGDWTDHAFRLGRALRRGLKK
jgi:hypothetical protein